MNTTTTAAAQLSALKIAQRIYDLEFSACPRSPEFKAGALRALRLKAGLTPAASPYESGTARDDAWLAGHQAGLAEWKWQASRAAEAGMSGVSTPRTLTHLQACQALVAMDRGWPLECAPQTSAPSPVPVATSVQSGGQRAAAPVTRPMPSRPSNPFDGDRQ